MEQQHRQAQQQNQQLTQVILDQKQRQRRELQCPHQITTHTQSKHLCHTWATVMGSSLT